MGIPDLLKRKKLKREGQKIADRIAIAYPQNLALQPDAEEYLVIRSIYFDEIGYQDPSGHTEDEIAICCKTVNGLSYLLALQFSSIMQGATNYAILEFTRYLDNELESLGFPHQSLEQKEEILKAMKLDITRWQTWDDSMK